METSMEDLVPSVSIEHLLSRRDAAVERVRALYATLGELASLGISSLSVTSDYHRYHHDEAETIRRVIDAPAWADLLDRSGLRSFLDAKARESWRKALEEHDVPPFTFANIKATFSTLYEARGEMFERGVVELFRKLSWDYKTNCPRKFGKRLVMTCMVDTWGTGRDRHVTGVTHAGANKLDDLVRVLSVLDGTPEPDHRTGAWRRLNDVSWMRHGGTSDADLGYFSLRGYKNGNAHLTFACPELVDRMNAILAKHCPNHLPPA